MKGISGIIHSVTSPSYLPLTPSPSSPPLDTSLTPISSDPSSTPISQIYDKSESPLSTLPVIPQTEIELKTRKDSLIDTQMILRYFYTTFVVSIRSQSPGLLGFNKHICNVNSHREYI